MPRDWQQDPVTGWCRRCGRELYQDPIAEELCDDCQKVEETEETQCP